MLVKLIREPLNTNKKYKIQEFKEYLNTLNSEKVVIYHNSNPAVYDVNKIKQALINNGFYDNNHYLFQFKMEKGNLIITR